MRQKTAEPSLEELSSVIESIHQAGPDGAGRALRIALTTLRTHLSLVFEKTATKRRAELVRLLQELAELS